MVNVTASDVKLLRDRTNAGIMDCKKALVESAGDVNAAIEWLRKKGLAAASRKSDRAAEEGLIVLHTNAHKGVILELNSETDFVARNEKFQDLAKQLATSLIDFNGSVEDFMSSKGPGGTISEFIAEHIAIIGENINLKRFDTLEVTQGVIASYTHSQVIEGAGKIGVLVALESNADISELMAFGKQLAMHIAAARPQVLTLEELEPSKIEKEKEILTEQVRASGKPVETIPTIVEGKIKKYYEEVVLLEQAFVMDGKTKIKVLIEDAAKRLGHSIRLQKYLRYSIGEAVDKALQKS